MNRSALLGLIVSLVSGAAQAAVDITANQIGRLTSVGNGLTRTFRQYDANGRAVATQYVQDGQSRIFLMAYGYPQNPQSASGLGTVIVSQTFPDGELVAYTYDASGVQVTARSTFGGVSEDVLRNLRLNARGQVTRIELGNGTVTTRLYDDSGHQGMSLTTTVNGLGQKVQEYGYAYDANVNVTGITDGVRPDLSATYTYDSLDQLTSIANSFGNVIEGYAYDAIGNLTQKGALIQTYGAGGRPHALATSGGVPYGYDANGNVITIGGNVTIEWTAEDMSARVMAGPVVTQKSFVQETLWKKVEEGVTTYYLPSMRLENGTARKYYGAYAERFEQPGDRQLRFYHPDQLGSSSVMTDQSGSVIRRASYFPWGQERGVDGTFIPKLQFNFKEKDATGFYDYGARLYNPATGRWLSPDDDTSDGTNRYAYVRNNPVTYIDPDGHQKKLPPGVVSSKTENGQTTYTYKDGTVEVMDNQDAPGTSEYRAIQNFNAVAGFASGAVSATVPGAGLVLRRIEGKPWTWVDSAESALLVVPVVGRGVRAGAIAVGWARAGLAAKETEMIIAGAIKGQGLGIGRFGELARDGLRPTVAFITGWTLPRNYAVNAWLIEQRIPIKVSPELAKLAEKEFGMVMNNSARNAAESVGVLEFRQYIAAHYIWVKETLTLMPPPR